MHGLYRESITRSHRSSSTFATIASLGYNITGLVHSTKGQSWEGDSWCKFQAYLDVAYFSGDESDLS